VLVGRSALPRHEAGRTHPKHAGPVRAGRRAVVTASKTVARNQGRIPSKRHNLSQRSLTLLLPNEEESNMLPWLLAAQLIVTQAATAPDDIADDPPAPNPTTATGDEPPLADPADPPPADSEPICERGATRACACTDGGSGAQQCLSGDAGWGACTCERQEAPAPVAKPRQPRVEEDYNRPRRRDRKRTTVPPPDPPTAEIANGDIAMACVGSFAGYIASSCVFGLTYWLCPPSILAFPLLQSYVMMWISDAYTDRRGAVVWSALAGYAAWFASVAGLLAFAVVVGLIGAAIGAVVGVASGTGARDVGAWGSTAGILAYFAASPLIALAVGIAPVAAWYYGSEPKLPDDNGGGFPGFLVPSIGSRPAASDHTYAMAY
jgi:hypothetical protein